MNPGSLPLGIHPTVNSTCERRVHRLRRVEVLIVLGISLLVPELAIAQDIEPKTEPPNQASTPGEAAVANEPAPPPSQAAVANEPAPAPNVTNAGAREQIKSLSPACESGSASCWGPSGDTTVDKAGPRQAEPQSSRNQCESGSESCWGPGGGSAANARYPSASAASSSVHPERPQATEGEEPEPARTGRNAVYAELLGAAIGYSVNYERIYTEHFAVRVGGSYLAGDYGAVLVAQPIFYLGGGSHKMEFALGAAVATGHGGSDFKSLWCTGTFGWRYIPKRGGFTAGAGMAFLFDNDDFVPWPEAKLGYLF